MIAARCSRISSITIRHSHIHAAIFMFMGRRRAMRRTAHSTAYTSQPAESPSNRSSGISSRNTASNPADPTGTTFSGATKPAFATTSATRTGPTTRPSSERRANYRKQLFPRAPLSLSMPPTAPRTLQTGPAIRTRARNLNTCALPHQPAGPACPRQPGRPGRRAAPLVILLSSDNIDAVG